MGLIFVDSSVWIDFLNARQTVETTLLRRLDAGKHVVVIGDLVLAEVLQGTRSQRAFDGALALFAGMTRMTVSDHEVAIQAARNYRTLRGQGVTIRKTIDVLIATRCILDGVALLYRDRDFDPFVQHLGLRSAMTILPE